MVYALLYGAFRNVTLQTSASAGESSADYFAFSITNRSITMTSSPTAGPIMTSKQFLRDNEIHHRGQGYVYLRSLGTEPPPFWERG